MSILLTIKIRYHLAKRVQDIQALNNYNLYTLSEEGMQGEKDTIYVTLPNRRKGILMFKNDYELISAFILDTINQEKEISLDELIEKAKVFLSGKIKGDLGWCLLLVKQELESRKIIRSIPGSPLQRVPKLKLKRKLLSLNKGQAS